MHLRRLSTHAASGHHQPPSQLPAHPLIINWSCPRRLFDKYIRIGSVSFARAQKHCFLESILEPLQTVSSLVFRVHGSNLSKVCWPLKGWRDRQLLALPHVSLQCTCLSSSCLQRSAMKRRAFWKKIHGESQRRTHFLSFAASSRIQPY